MPKTASAHVAVAIKIPAPSSLSSALRRRPQYVSVNTQSASIAVQGAATVVANLAATSPNCTVVSGGRMCTVSVDAPVGVDTFSETLYTGANASGAVLSTGRTSAQIQAGTANTVLLTLDGVIASLSLTLADATPPLGARATIGLTVNFVDASGASIIGSDPFVTPVTLSDSDTSGATTLSATTLNSPSDASALTLAYTGASITQAVIGASAGSVAASSVTLIPKNPSTSFNDYSTFAYDTQRDVFNPNSTAITPGNLSSLHLAWQATVGDYNTQTQPVLSTEIPGYAGVLFVGGGSGNVYAYDAHSGALVWKRYLGQETYDFCGGTSYVGVGGTVAYDPSSKSLYVVGNSSPGLDTYGSAALYHLDAATGNILGHVNFTPSAVGPSEFDFGHTSVTLNNGVAYVGTGTTCDYSSWRGRVVAIDVPSMTIANTFFTVWDPNNTRGLGAQPWGGGGIWGWGGVSLDFSGNVLTGVGNTDDGADGLPNDPIQSPFVPAPHEYNGFGETLLELTSDVSTVIASNHPIPPGLYGPSGGDLDVQGTPLVFRPNGSGCGTMVALQAKSGELTFYNESGLGNGPAAQFQLSPVTPLANDAYLGDPAYSAATGLVYAPVASSVSPSLFPPGLIAINPGCGNPSVVWHAAFGSDSSSSGTPRSVPAASAGGVVFAGSASGNGGDVWAVDASTGNLLNGGSPILQTSGFLRMPATIDGDWVFILDNNGDMYGLTTDSRYPAIAVRARPVDPRSRQIWHSRANRGS